MIAKGLIGQVKMIWCRHFIGYGGDAYFKDWHSERNKSTGLLLQKAAHDIDVMHWLAGAYTKRVNAMGGLTLYNLVKDRRNHNEKGDATFRKENWPPLSQKGLSPVIDVEDVSMMQMEFDNGVFAAYQQCHYTPDSWRNYTIIGTEGRIENFGDYSGNCTIKLWNKRTDYNPDGDQQYFISNNEGTHGGSDPQIVAEFVKYISQNAKILTSATAARNSVATGYAATLSLRNGCTTKEITPIPPHIIEYFEKDVRYA